MLRCLIASVFCSLLLTASLSASGGFQGLYEHYFPKNSEYLEGGYREWFDRVIFADPAPEGISENEQKMRSAVRREPGGFHAFVNSPYREFDGEFGETWFFQCQLLLLVLGDEEFARLLSKEDLETQRFVSRGLVHNIEWDKHPFPKTHEIVKKVLNRS